jgi:hypothetical protein
MPTETDVNNSSVDTRDIEVPAAIEDKFNEVMGTEDPGSGTRSDRQARQVAEDENDVESEDNEELPGGEQAKEEPAPTGETELDDPEAGGEAAPEEEESAASKLDPNLVFAAQQFGWSDEDIENFAKAAPEQAERTFRNLLNNYAAVRPQVAQPAPAATATAARKVETALQKLLQPDVYGRFAQANGNDVAEALKATAELYGQLTEEVSGLKAEYLVAKQNAIREEATAAINGLSEKFPDVYGGKAVNLAQGQARQTLAGLADSIRAGELMQGRNMTVSEALNKAHLIVAANSIRKSERAAVRTAVLKRVKGLTARPTTRRPAPHPSSATAKAEAAFRIKADEIGLDQAD